VLAVLVFKAHPLRLLMVALVLAEHLALDIILVAAAVVRLILGLPVRAVMVVAEMEAQLTVGLVPQERQILAEVVAVEGHLTVQAATAAQASSSSK
jgi:hypothetical protein